MKKLLTLFSLAAIAFISSCKQDNATATASNDYFKPHSSGLQNGNIQLIPIQTP